MMKNLRVTLAIIFSLTSGITQAHTGLKNSTPTANAMLSESPKAISVEFDNNVRLVKLELKNERTGKIKIPFRASANADKAFTIALPELDSGSYSVFWTVMGDDGHKMKGSFTFMLHHSKDMKSMQMKTMDHSKHSK